MKFRIYRTSDFNEENKPCEQAQFDDILGYWFIHLDTMNNIVSLKEEVGDIIIKEGYNEIEIYDEDRE